MEGCDGWLVESSALHLVSDTQRGIRLRIHPSVLHSTLCSDSNDDAPLLRLGSGAGVLARAGPFLNGTSKLTDHHGDILLERLALHVLLGLGLRGLEGQPGREGRRFGGRAGSQED